MKCTIYELIYLDYECVYILYIVPADDMGVVGHTQKTQTPMSFANSHKYIYIYIYVFRYSPFKSSPLIGSPLCTAGARTLSRGLCTDDNFCETDDNAVKHCFQNSWTYYIQFLLYPYIICIYVYLFIYDVHMYIYLCMMYIWCNLLVFMILSNLYTGSK